MGMAPVAHVVWNKFMTFNPKNPEWVNRDRFVLSYVLPHFLHTQKQSRQWHAVICAGCAFGGSSDGDCIAFPRGI
jgi:hypothetical protein